MKTPSAWMLSLIALLPAAAQDTDAPHVALSPDPADASVWLNLQDGSNRVWTVERSEDLRTWTVVDAFSVRNSHYRRRLPLDATGRAFYRTSHNATWAPDPATVVNALIDGWSLETYANPTLPASFRVQPIVGQDNTPADNPVTDAGARLGRVLFYDRRLSANGAIACASCHQQEHGFSDPRRFSVGFHGGLTGRNSMGLANARWYQRRRFFWDERAATLEDQVLQPIQNGVEMGLTLPELVARVSAQPYYATLFTAAFGDPSVTSNRIARALAQFVRSIISTRTRYDTGAATGFVNFTAQENLGRQIFLGQVGNATCAACHGTDNFVPGPAINNNGLENPYLDKGLGAITGLAADEGKFKVPSLRNIALTAPYMHDGRFATLEEVVEFYNAGVVNHPNLSPPLLAPRRPGQPPTPRRLNLTTEQKTALVAFLRTLTDDALAADPRFADPFRYQDP